MQRSTNSALCSYVDAPVVWPFSGVSIVPNDTEYLYTPNLLQTTVLILYTVVQVICRLDVPLTNKEGRETFRPRHLTI